MDLERLYTVNSAGTETTAFRLGDYIRLTAESQNNGVDGTFNTNFYIYIDITLCLATMKQFLCPP